MLLGQSFARVGSIKSFISLLLAVAVAGEGVAAPARNGKKPTHANNVIANRVDETPFYRALGGLGGVTERDPAVGRARGVVVHLLDIHGDETAQRGLGKALEAAVGAGADLIGLEGAFAPFDVSGFSEAVDPTARRATADFLLKENRITGPLHAALTTERPFPPMEGIDDPPLYRRNVDAARRAARERPVAAGRAGAALTALSAEQERVYNPALRALDRAVRAAESDPGKWVEGLRALVNVAGDRATPHVQAFLRAADAPFDLPRAAAEARRLATLVGPVHFPPDREALLGPAGPGLEPLRRMLADRGLSLEKEAPLLSARAARAAEAAKIPGRVLLDEFRLLETRATDRLARTDAEKVLVRRTNDLRLCAGLVDLGLSPMGWSAYKLRRRARDFESPLTDAEASVFERFYETAEARDRAMLGGLLRAAEARRATRLVLVTGGFHADRMRTRLTEAGWTVLTHLPRKGDGTNPATDPFAREASVLDRLAAGDLAALNIDLSPEGGWPHRGLLGLLAVGESAGAGDRPTADETRLARRLLGPAATAARATAAGPETVHVDLAYRGRRLGYEAGVKNGVLAWMQPRAGGESPERGFWGRAGATVRRWVRAFGSPGAPSSGLESTLLNALADRLIAGERAFDLLETPSRIDLSPRFTPRPSPEVLQGIREVLKESSGDAEVFGRAALSLLSAVDPEPLLVLEASPPRSVSPFVFAVFMAQAHTVKARLNDRHNYLYEHHMRRALDWWDEAERRDPAAPEPDLYRALAGLDGAAWSLAKATRADDRLHWVLKLAQHRFQPGELNEDAFRELLKKGRPVDGLVMAELARRPAESVEDILNTLIRSLNFQKQIGDEFASGLPESYRSRFLRNKHHDENVELWNFQYMINAYAGAVYDAAALVEGKLSAVREKAFREGAEDYRRALRQSHVRAGAAIPALERLIHRADLTPNHRYAAWSIAVYLSAWMSFLGRYRMGVREGWPETVDALAPARLRDLSRRALSLMDSADSDDPRFLEKRSERADQLLAGFLEAEEFAGMPIQQVWDIFGRLAPYLSTQYLCVFMGTDDAGVPNGRIGKDPSSWRLGLEVLRHRLPRMGAVDLSWVARLHPSVGAPFRQRARDLLPVFVAAVEHDGDRLHTRQDNLHSFPGRVRVLKALVDRTGDLPGPGTVEDFQKRLDAAFAENQAVEKEATDLLRNQNALLGFLRAEARRVTQELVAADRAYRRSLRGALVASDFGSFPDIYHSFPLTRDPPVEGLLAAREDLLEALRAVESGTDSTPGPGKGRFRRWWNAATQPVRALSQRVRRAGGDWGRVWRRWRGADDSLARDAFRLAAFVDVPTPRRIGPELEAEVWIDDPGLAGRVLAQSGRRGLGRLGLVLRREMGRRRLDRPDAARWFDALARAALPVPADRPTVQDAEAPAPRPVHVVFVNDAAGLGEAKKFASDFASLHRNTPEAVLLLVRAEPSLPEVVEGLDFPNVRWVQPRLTEDGRVVFASLSETARRVLTEAGLTDRPLRWRAVNPPARGVAGLEAAPGEDPVVDALRQALIQALKNAPLYTLEELSNLLRAAELIATQA